MRTNLRILVICGGFSQEREVSLRSGTNVHAALVRLGYSKAQLFDLRDLNSISELVRISPNIDLAILVSHGTYGEDGCLQGLLELIKIPYTGSSVLASALAMNKLQSKALLKASGLAVLPAFSLLETELSERAYIAKPISDGSSVGIVKANNLAELRNFANQVEDASKYFVEPFIKGTEVTTSIIPYRSDLPCNADCLIDSDLVSLPILELKPLKEFYDYEAKYTKGLTEFILPARLSPELSLKIHKAALQAYRTLACSAFARVDFIIDGEEPYILELNSLPGMTDTSDLPAQAAATGISYDALVELLVETAA